MFINRLYNFTNHFLSVISFFRVFLLDSSLCSLSPALVCRLKGLLTVSSSAPSTVWLCSALPSTQSAFSLCKQAFLNLMLFLSGWGCTGIPHFKLPGMRFYCWLMVFFPTVGQTTFWFLVVVQKLGLVASDLMATTVKRNKSCFLLHER